MLAEPVFDSIIRADQRLLQNKRGGYNHAVRGIAMEVLEPGAQGGYGDGQRLNENRGTRVVFNPFRNRRLQAQSTVFGKHGHFPQGYRGERAPAFVTGKKTTPFITAADPDPGMGVQHHRSGKRLTLRHSSALPSSECLPLSWSGFSSARKELGRRRSPPEPAARPRGRAA